MRGALLSAGSTPYFFADLCQEVDTCSTPGGGAAPSAIEQTCSACPVAVSSELAQRSEVAIMDLLPGDRQASNTSPRLLRLTTRIRQHLSGSSRLVRSWASAGDAQLGFVAGAFKVAFAFR